MYRITFVSEDQASTAKWKLGGLPGFRFSMMWLKKDIHSIDVVTVCSSQLPKLQSFATERSGTLHKLTDDEVRREYCWLCMSELPFEGANECVGCHTAQCPEQN